MVGTYSIHVISIDKHEQSFDLNIDAESMILHRKRGEKIANSPGKEGQDDVRN